MSDSKKIVDLKIEDLEDLKIEDLKKELDAMIKKNEFLDEFSNKGESNWTEKDIKTLIDYFDYFKGSEKGDNLVLKVVKHKNFNSDWLEDFCLAGFHPIKVIKNALKNPNMNSWLLNELYERDKSQNDEKAEWRSIDYEILHHPLCPKDIKYVYIDIFFDKLSTYNNMIDQGYGSNSHKGSVFINGDEYQGAILIKSFEDLSKLYNVLNETNENDLDYVAPELYQELADVFGDKISNKWIDDLEIII